MAVMFFTHILGHSDWEHLSNNYLKILLLGPLIEEKYGSINYLIMILLMAFVVAVYNFIKGKDDNIAHDTHLIRRIMWCSIWFYMYKPTLNKQNY